MTDKQEQDTAGDHVKPVAWRWSFDGCQMTWHYATTKPGKFRGRDPDTIQPLYLHPATPAVEPSTTS